MDLMKFVTGAIVILGSGAILAKLVDSGKEADSKESDTKSAAPTIERPKFREPIQTRPGVPNAPIARRPIGRIQPAALGRLRAL